MQYITMKFIVALEIPPFQASTQATLLVAENATPSKKILAAKTYTKFCSCSKDYEHRNSCTANLDPDDSIGNEGDYLRHAIACR